jgi:hypothetical protein
MHEVHLHPAAFTALHRRCLFRFELPEIILPAARPVYFLRLVVALSDHPHPAARVEGEAVSRRPFEEPNIECGEVPPPGTHGIGPCVDDEFCCPVDYEDARGETNGAGDLFREPAPRLP